MNTDRNRLFYYIGTGLLIVALIELTLFPFFINRMFPALFIPMASHKKIVLYLYLASFILYFFSIKYYKRQIYTLIWLFVFYAVFQLIAHFI